MPGHTKKKTKGKNGKNGKNGNGLTAKQKTLPAFLQKKIMQKKRGKK